MANVHDTDLAMAGTQSTRASTDTGTHDGIRGHTRERAAHRGNPDTVIGSLHRKKRSQIGARSVRSEKRLEIWRGRQGGLGDGQPEPRGVRARSGKGVGSSTRGTTQGGAECTQPDSAWEVRVRAEQAETDAREPELSNPRQHQVALPTSVKELIRSIEEKTTVCQSDKISKDISNLYPRQAISDSNIDHGRPWSTMVDQGRPWST